MCLKALSATRRLLGRQPDTKFVQARDVNVVGYEATELVTQDFPSRMIAVRKQASHHISPIETGIL